ncbi:MAG TPA: potassium-transporting ATPase subunit KdpC [Caulobacteraceae bacterium]
MLSQLRPAIVSTIFFTLLLGVGYPLAITGIARLAMPARAEGSLIRGAAGEVVGSSLIAQAFVQARYLHPRPSAAGKGYEANNSGGSNYGPLNSHLAKRIKADAEALRASTGRSLVPADAVTTSASGLDPDISPAYALMQAPRIAAARGADPARVKAFIANRIEPPFLGFIGQPRVNVLTTNLALDGAFARVHPPAS